MIILNKEEMKRAVTMKEAVNLASEALRLYTTGKSNIPLRTGINIEKSNGNALFMPGYVDEIHAAGIKIVSIFPNNHKIGLPAVPASMILLDANTGVVSAVMDGTYLTQLRTGAVAGCATELLSRKDSKIMALIGTGGQAKAQVEAVLSVRNIEEIKVFDLSNDEAEAFASMLRYELKDFHGNINTSKTSFECIEDADIITTVTTSKIPTFDGSKVKLGAHINAMGSYTPDSRELDEVILDRASLIYLDTLDGVLSEAGDFIIPMENNRFSKEKITGELGELILSKTKSREDENQITVFKSVGTAVLDIVTAKGIYEKAKNMNMGREVTL